ncbi:MAG: divalent-cation tolerance protein CutA [Alphaproteobacteria bacterium]|nr:MAG: divalent-cation tolerance protein CutA [Alphaproteobacteria bacterium]
MSDRAQVLLVEVTCPDRASAERIGRAAVAARLAACANVGAPVRSIFRWQGAIESEDEVQLWLKTTEAAWPALEALIRREHPYELPVVLALPARCAPDVAAWAEGEVAPQSPTTGK